MSTSLWSSVLCHRSLHCKGRVVLPKRMNFRKNSKRPLTPPLIFGKSYCGFFPEYMTEEPFIMAKICNVNFWIGNGPSPFGTFPKIHPLWKGSASLMPVYTVHLYLSLSFLCLHSACVFTCDFVHVCENLTYAIFTVRLVPMLGVLYLHHPRMLENAFQRNFFFNFHSFIFW